MAAPPVKVEQLERAVSSTDLALTAAYAGDDPSTLSPARRWYLANQSVEANPGVPGGFVVRAVAFLAMGRPWEAVADLDRALRFAIRDATTTRCDRRSADDEEARIRLLRGHAHTACLSYERAAADFTTAAEILDSLEENDEANDGIERATSAHARAGLGVCYCHMRRWSDAIRSGETAILELAYDDIARTHVSRAVETARQHLAMERRGTGGSGGSSPFASQVTVLSSSSSHHKKERIGNENASHHQERPSKRVLLAKQQHPTPMHQQHHHHHHQQHNNLSQHQQQQQRHKAMDGGGGSSSSTKVAFDHHMHPHQQHHHQGNTAPSGGHHHNGGMGVGGGDDKHLSIRGRESSSMSMASLPKNLSVASIAMSLSMASICSDSWELGGETSADSKKQEPSSARDDDDDHNVGLHLDDTWQQSAGGVHH